MDLKDIIARATQASKTALTISTPTVRATNDSAALNCKCGHPKGAHDDDGDCRVCLASGGECTSYYPASHDYDINAQPPYTPPMEASGDAIRTWEPIETPQVIDQVSTSESQPLASENVEEVSGPEDCAHLCKCGKWWSHGNKMKCRFPDLTEQGLCPTCLNGDEPFNPIAALEEDEVGRKSLTPAAQIEVRN